MAGWFSGLLFVVAVAVAGGAWCAFHVESGGAGVADQIIWDDSCPAWSPDGKRIAFASTRADYGHDKSGWYLKASSLDDYVHGVVSGYTYDLYVMNAGGSRVVRLTHVAGSARPRAGHQRSVDQAAPVWSKDGRTIFFTVTSPALQAGDSETGVPLTRRGRAYAVNSTGRPQMRPALLSDLPGTPRYPTYDYGAQIECPANAPHGRERAFYRTVDTDTGLGGGFGMEGVICGRPVDGKDETVSQVAGDSCPSTTVS